jgi:hypothetical protein
VESYKKRPRGSIHTTALLDHACVHALFQAVGDFLFGHAARLRGVDPQQLEHALGRRGQQLHEGSRHPSQPGHRLRQQARHSFRIELADPLGYQFSEDDRYIGDQRHDDSGGCVSRGTLAQAQALQPVREPIAERGFADDSIEHADGGDTYLHGGQEPGGLFHQLEGGHRARVSAFRQQGKPGLSAGGQRQFRHGEHAVQQREQRNQQDFHRIRAP